MCANYYQALSGPCQVLTQFPLVNMQVPYTAALIANFKFHPVFCKISLVTNRELHFAYFGAIKLQPYKIGMELKQEKPFVNAFRVKYVNLPKKKPLAPLDIFYTNLYIDGHGNITEMLEMFSSLNDLGPLQGYRSHRGDLFAFIWKKYWLAVLTI